MTNIVELGFVELFCNVSKADFIRGLKQDDVMRRKLVDMNKIPVVYAIQLSHLDAGTSITRPLSSSL